MRKLHKLLLLTVILAAFVAFATTMLSPGALARPAAFPVLASLTGRAADECQDRAGFFDGKRSAAVISGQKHTVGRSCADASWTKSAGSPAVEGPSKSAAYYGSEDKPCTLLGRPTRNNLAGRFLSARLISAPATTTRPDGHFFGLLEPVSTPTATITSDVPLIRGPTPHA